MSNRNTIILLISLLVVIVSTSLLVRLNPKKANYQPPTFVGKSETHNTKIKAADLAFTTGKLPEALKLYKEIQDIYPNNLPLHNRIGLINLRLGKFIDAEKTYRDLVKKAPDNAHYNSSLSLTLLNLKNYSSALNFAEQAILLKPKDGLPFLVEAAVYAQREDVDKVIKSFSQIQPSLFLFEFIKRPEFQAIKNSEKFKTFMKSATVQNGTKK
ncbi:MAG: tetratricopeptide repeat protein [Lentisphaeraceae bacterium]|nr:tetratricopeptide repeat protein [Lentisphaeraceae bacterium]